MSSYKDSLNLPKTDFPMKAGLTEREPQMLARWEQADLYAQIQAARADSPDFILHDGPPFANGDVHMGTALNKVLKDLIVKSKTMAGYRAPFIPGWDCHGLPIEFKVVKESRGLSPVQIREKSEEYARKYIDIQRRQFRRLGVFGDWENPYLTLDPGYEAEIIRSFGRFVEKGLVYLGKKPVLWSTGAQTALAEAEVEYAKRTDPAIYVKFPLVTGPLAGKANMVIWTTTPWTLPANVAIAVEPRAEYVCVAVTKPDAAEESVIIAKALLEKFLTESGYVLAGAEPQTFVGGDLAGWEAQHPFLPRMSRVITADFVTMETGTGQVHIAPGHGKDDYIAGQQNGLPTLSPVDDLGKFTDEVGMSEWAGKYVFEANKEIVEFLRERGSLVAAHDYTHDYPHCWRSKTPIVFRSVEQFFIRVDDIRTPALTAVDQTKWLPQWGRNRIAGTVESRPDWCISRQRTWGVPLPVFYDAAGTPIMDSAVIGKVADLVKAQGTNLWFEKDDAWWAEAVELPAGTTRRHDTLDVWIDSGVSHEAVLRQRPELKFPADVYLEATDQHRGWFQSSLMTSVALNDCAPYREVITHGFVVDKDGKKISKSAEYKKPQHAEHFVNQYGADILRLWVATVNYTDEVPFGEDMFKQVSERYRGFRNILRILLANLSDFSTANASLDGATAIDRWALSRLQEVTAKCRSAYSEYDFRGVFETLNQFCAVDLSALYIDITKDRMYCDTVDSPRRRATQTVMQTCFDSIARLLAPILVFTAEEAWDYFKPGSSIHLETFPEVDAAWDDDAIRLTIKRWLEWRGRISQVIEQSQKNGELAKPLEARVQVAVKGDAERADLLARKSELEEFWILSELEIVAGSEDEVKVTKTAQIKCERCWRHRPDVGTHADHPTLCGRCTEAVLSRILTA